MGLDTALRGLRARFAKATRRDPLTERVRRQLVRNLYNQPASLAIGAVNGVIACSITAWFADNRWFTLGVVVLAVVAVARTILAFSMQKDDHRVSTRTMELLFEVGAFSYALILGLLAGASIAMQLSTAAEVLMLANAMGYGVGICARNAGRPFIALGQLTFSIVPMLVAALMVGSPLMIVLAVNLFLLLPAMASITRQLFGELRDSIAAAETSAKLADKMRKLARTDVVTGLANRAGFNHDLVEALMALEHDAKLAMLWLDLDRFKEVNDLLGHQIGDRVLASVAARMRENAPPGATVARFGGDEFVMFFPVRDRSESERIATLVREQVSRPLRLESELLDVSASMGVALLPEDGDDADNLMQSADLALYHAKVNGRAQTCFFDHSMSRDLVRKREIEAELRAALQKDELSIFFQPIVDLETGRIRAFEALVRWFHPEKGELRPDEFIPVAEETGVIVTLGNWITAQAAKAAAQWPEDVTLAVNLSPLQIRAPGAALGVMAALRDAGLPPERLELEVTESLFLDDSESTAAFIEELSVKGVRFALDDFGTGYSSLGYINKYPFSKIKVDRSFVSGPNVGRKSDAIIRAVAEMGSTLEMSIVAEGLETVEQVQAVREAGCTLGQGWYFSRAVPDYLAAMLLTQERENEAGLMRKAAAG